MKTKILTLSLAFLLWPFAVFSLGADITMLILSEEGSPVEIVEFKRTNAIKLKNISDKKIEAIEFRRLNFDAFNRYMTTTFLYRIWDKKKGKALSPQEVKNETWGPNEYWNTGEYIEGTLYTTICYVSNVRFTDGSMWDANIDFIIERVMEMMNCDLSNVIKNLKW